MLACKNFFCNCHFFVKLSALKLTENEFLFLFSKHFSRKKMCWFRIKRLLSYCLQNGQEKQHLLTCKVTTIFTTPIDSKLLTFDSCSFGCDLSKMQPAASCAPQSKAFHTFPLVPDMFAKSYVVHLSFQGFGDRTMHLLLKVKYSAVFSWEWRGGGGLKKI